jgi:F0F1-type ATP synthase assembly protein I
MTDSNAIKDKGKQEETNKRPETIKSTLMFSEHLRVTGMVVTISLLCIAGFALLGWFLDGYFGTRPIIAVFAVVFSFPFSQFLIYKWINKKYVPRLIDKSHTK